MFVLFLEFSNYFWIFVRFLRLFLFLFLWILLSDGIFLNFDLIKFFNPYFEISVRSRSKYLFGGANVNLETIVFIDCVIFLNFGYFVVIL